METKKAALESCLPEKLSTFIDRETDVEKIYSLLVKDSSGVVSIVGGPGFGKSTIAVKVSHRINEECDILVIFSYLSNVSNVAQAVLRLCLDVGVHPGEDPKSSLIFWSRNIEKKLIVILDNIDKLLEKENNLDFNDLMCLLRKNSGQRLQIITTSRAVFSIPHLKVQSVTVGEMDADSSTELLRKHCPNVKMEEDYWNKLSKLCGHVPLALCIAASRIQDTDDPTDLIKWLESQPMKVLQSPENGQHVSKAIGMSFEKLSDEDKKSFVRLSVLDGNFDRSAAAKIIDREGLETQDFLKNLVNRSLMQRGGERFTIHPLVRRFLTEQHHLQSERETAQELMVEHYLKMCQSLTLKFYSKDGFNDAREALKKDVHNIEETMKVCCDQNINLVPPNKIESLVIKSDVYQSSARFFYNSVRNFLSPAVMKHFLEFCAGLAKMQKNVAIEMNFQCLLADQEGHDSDWNKSNKYMDMMKKIKEVFDENEEAFREDSAFLGHFYCSYGRYLFNESVKTSPVSPDLLQEADQYTQKSLKLRQNQASNPLEKADEAITLIQLGRISKKRGNKKYHSNNVEFKKLMTSAEKYYREALSIANEIFGEHEITFTCHKALGDLLMNWRKNEMALEQYNVATEMLKKLRLDFGKSLANLLKNKGSCLSYLRYFEQAVKQLEEARSIAEKLAEPPQCKAQVYYDLACVLSVWKRRNGGCQEAKEYAKKALALKEFLPGKSAISKMEQIMNEGESERLSWRR